MQIASANPSTAQTNAALVAASGTRTVKIKSIFVSSDTQMTVSIVNSSTHTVIWRMYVAADGGYYGDNLDLYQSNAGEGLDYTTSANGNAYLRVGYEI